MSTANVDVWWARPDSADWLADLLDDAELGRRSAYRTAADRDRFTTAGALLRLAAAQRLGVPPRDVPVDRRCVRCGAPHGRPSLRGSCLNVSISHAADRVAVAIGYGGPLGVDVEQLGDVDPGLANWIVASEEEPLPRDHQSFFRQWTRKEAVLKATGDGLMTSMSELVLEPHSGPPVVRRYKCRRNPQISLVDLSPGEGYVAALAVLTRQPLAVAERDARELLSAGQRSF